MPCSVQEKAYCLSLGHKSETLLSYVVCFVLKKFRNNAVFINILIVYHVIIFK